jgi:hypothetical protein
MRTMTKDVNNKEIIGFLKVVSTMDKYYANDSDKAFLRNYDACDDYVLSKIIIQKTWKELQSHFSGLNKITKIVNPISILHTNAGTGKVLADCPSDNVMVTALNNDYICKQISDILNQHFSVDFSYKSEISDISHYFINGDDGSTKKHDIVFTQPVKTDYYKDIDGTSLSSADYLKYYSARSLDFLTKGGYLCIFTHPQKFNILKDNNKLKGECTLVAEITNDNSIEDYGCLIFKKK